MENYDMCPHCSRDFRNKVGMNYYNIKSHVDACYKKKYQPNSKSLLTYFTISTPFFSTLVD